MDRAPSTPVRPLARVARRWVTRFVAASAATMIALLIAEGCVRVFAPQPLSGTWRDWKNGYPGNRASTTARHEYGNLAVTYRFNELGIRGAAVDPHAFRVLCLGDSFTFGWLLDEPQTFIGRMQERADAVYGPGRVQFLNAGVGGGSTASSLGFLEDHGDEVAPHAVLSFLNCWDIGRAAGSELYVPSASDQQTLERRNPPPRISGLSRAIAGIPGYPWLLEHSHLVQLARNIASRAASRRGDDEAQTVPAAAAAPGAPTQPVADDERAQSIGRSLYRRMKSWCAAHDVPVWVVTTGRPYKTPRDGTRTPAGDLEATLQFTSAAPAFFAEIGVPFADTTSAVTADCGGYFSRFQIAGEGHPNAQGAESMGRQAWDAVAPWLAAEISRRR